MVANPRYWKGRPQIDKFVLKEVPDPETTRMLFESGAVDLCDCDSAESRIPYFLARPKWSRQIASMVMKAGFRVTLKQMDEAAF